MTTGACNIALGERALCDATDNSGNIAIGRNALAVSDGDLSLIHI